MPFPPVQPLFLLDLETSIVADFFFFSVLVQLCTNHSSLIRSPVIAAAASIGRRLPLSVRAFTSAQGIPVTGKSGVDLISISVPFAGRGCVGWDISGT